MRHIWSSLLSSAVLCAASAGPQTIDPPRLKLYESGHVVSRIIVPDHPSAMESLAVRTVQDTLRTVWKFELPAIAVGSGPELHNAIVIGTPASNSILGKSSAALNPELNKIGEQGFLIERQKQSGATYLVLASSTPVGVFRGAQYLADFAIQSQGAEVFALAQTVTQKPAIATRGTYNLACWGLTPRYSLQDWEKIIDAMAADGMNVIYFWVSGLFRSKLYPETFIYPETQLTTENIRQLIHYANSHGVDFYLGTGVFAWFGVDEIAKHHDEVRELGIDHMCRTLPAAQKAMQAYLTELYDTFPEAKGMWLEIGCEGDYHCTGPLCQRKIDDYGSRQIGKSELSFLKRFSNDLWQQHPEAKLVWGVGYPEAHQWDVNYYDEIRRDFRDPRYRFLEVRQNWELPDAQGVLHPLTYVSQNMMHWDQYYALPLRDLGEHAQRIHEDGLSGWIVAFEPGFSTHSIYGGKIPYPVDAIPYRLTRFAYQQFTSNPGLSWSGFQKRLLDHFFGEGANPELVDLTLTVFDLIRTGPIQGAYNELITPVDGMAYGRMLKPRLAAIEARLNILESQMPARGRNIGLPLLRRAIQDTRGAYSIER